MREADTNREGSIQKVEFPKFKGENLSYWLYKTQQFFQTHNVLDALKVPLTSIHFENRALFWYHSYLKENNRVILSWVELVNALKIQFGNMVDDQVWVLKCLKQKASMREYYDLFALSTSHLYLPQEYALNCFLEGMKEEIQSIVRMYTPKSMKEAYDLAILQETVLEFQHSKDSGIQLCSEFSCLLNNDEPNVDVEKIIVFDSQEIAEDDYKSVIAEDDYNMLMDQDYCVKTNVQKEHVEFLITQIDEAEIAQKEVEIAQKMVEIAQKEVPKKSHAESNIGTLLTLYGAAKQEYRAAQVVQVVYGVAEIGFWAAKYMSYNFEWQFEASVDFFRCQSQTLKSGFKEDRVVNGKWVFKYKKKKVGRWLVKWKWKERFEDFEHSCVIVLE